MTPALRHLVAVSTAGAPAEELVSALKAWLVGQQGDERLPPDATAAVLALVHEAEDHALLALVEAPEPDAYRSDDWQELISAAVWLRALVGRAAARGGEASFDAELDGRMEQRFGHDDDLAPGRALVRATWPDWPTEPRWWRSGPVRGVESSSDAEVGDDAIRGLVAWGRSRMTADGRFRFSPSEWDRLMASDGGAALLGDAGALFLRDAVSVDSSWASRGRPPIRVPGWERRRVPVPRRLAAASAAAVPVWRDGHPVLFQFAATRAWIHVGVGICAAGQATEFDVTGQVRPAWLVLPEPGVTRLDWNGGSTAVPGPGGLVIDVLDPSVRLEIVASGVLGARRVVLSASDDFGDGDFGDDNITSDGELEALLVDVRSADFDQARHRLRDLQERLTADERRAVAAIERLLETGETL